MLSMNLSEPFSGVAALVLGGGAQIVLLILCGLALRKLRQQGIELQALRQRMEALSSDMSALCAGSIGVDRRVSCAEGQIRALEQWRELLEQRQEDDRPYGEAIQLVHKGASAPELVRELGLSHSEAELVAMLHGVDKAS